MGDRLNPSRNICKPGIQSKRVLNWLKHAHFQASHIIDAVRAVQVFSETTYTSSILLLYGPHAYRKRYIASLETVQRLMHLIPKLQQLAYPDFSEETEVTNSAQRTVFCNPHLHLQNTRTSKDSLGLDTRCIKEIYILTRKCWSYL